MLSASLNKTFLSLSLVLTTSHFLWTFSERLGALVYGDCTSRSNHIRGKLSTTGFSRPFSLGLYLSAPIRQLTGTASGMASDSVRYFSFQPVLHDWSNKGRGMCCPGCGMVHIKEPLLLIGKSSPCGGSGFPFSLSEWSLTICLTPYNRK